MYAYCKDNVDPHSGTGRDLEVGKMYKVDSVDMSSCFTYIYLKGHERSYNSILFDFYDKHDIYSDPKYNPYL